MFLSCQKKSLESKIFALFVDHSIVPFKKSTTLLLCCFIKELRQYVMPIIVRSHIIREKKEKKRLFFNMPPSLYPMLLLGLYAKLGGLDLSRRDLDRDLDLDAQKVSVSTVEKISTVFKS